MFLFGCVSGLVCCCVLFFFFNIMHLFLTKKKERAIKGIFGALQSQEPLTE